MNPAENVQRPTSNFERSALSVGRWKFLGRFISSLHHLLSPWTWLMAWRDSRASRRKLLFFSCSIVLGIAALTAIGSLGRNLERAIAEQAKSLLGADLVIGARHPFTAEEDTLFREIGGEQSREISFSSMIFFVRSQGTRLAQVRALEGAFPFYGRLETEPATYSRAS